VASKKQARIGSESSRCLPSKGAVPIVRLNIEASIDAAGKVLQIQLTKEDLTEIVRHHCPLVIQAHSGAQVVI